MSTMSADGQSAVSMTSDGTRKINFKGKKGSSKGSSKLGGTSHTQGLAFIRDDVEAHSVLSNSLNSNAHSGSRSSATSNTKFLTLLSKLKAIKTSNKGDPSSIKLANVLNVMFVVYNIYFIIGLLVISLQPSAVIPYRLLITLLDTDMVVNEIITSAKVLYVDNNPDMVTSYCAWNPKYVTPIKPLCPWIEAGVAARAGLGEIDSLEDLYKKIPYDENRSQHPVRNMLPIYNTELSSVTTRLKTFYTSIRVPGDIFDQVLNGPFELYQFVNGTRGIPSNASYTTLWNVLATLSTATNILATEKELNEQSWRSWQFIVANRVRLTDIFINLARMIPPAATTAIVNNILFHFGMALVGVILTGLGFYFGIVPYVLEVNADRQKIIRLMVLIPKETIHTLVHEVYNEQDEDEEDNEVPGKGGKKEESDDTDSEEDDELSDYGQSQDIAVMADQGLRIYAYIGLALAVLVLPVVGFAIFRYARSFWCFDMIALLNNLAIMYHDMQTLAWQIFSGAYKCTDPTFCYPTAELGVKRLLYYVDEVFYIFWEARGMLLNDDNRWKTLTLKPWTVCKEAPQHSESSIVPFVSRLQTVYNAAFKSQVRICLTISLPEQPTGTATWFRMCSAQPVGMPRTS